MKILLVEDDAAIASRKIKKANIIEALRDDNA